MQLGIPRRHDHLEVLDGVIPHFYVVCDGVLKENDILIHHGERASKHAAVDLRDRFSVKQDLTAPRLIKAGDQLGDRGLSAARSADKRHAVPGLEREVEIPDQRLGQARIAEGDIFELDIAGQLAVFRALIAAVFRKDIVVGIAHHILDPLHIGAHFLQRLSRRNERRRGGEEGGQKALKRHDHADGKAALHREEHACHQNRGAADRADKRRQQSEELVHALEADLTGIDARLVTRPLFKKAVLRAARLDRFDHLDAGDVPASLPASRICTRVRLIRFFEMTLERTKLARIETSPMSVRSTL